MPCVCKFKYESVVVVVAVSISCSKIKKEGEEEAGNIEEGNDKEQFRLVVDRMANEIRVESLSCVGWSPKRAGSGETTKSQWTKKGSFQCYWRIWSAGQG